MGFGKSVDIADIGTNNVGSDVELGERAKYSVTALVKRHTFEIKDGESVGIGW